MEAVFTTCDVRPRASASSMRGTNRRSPWTTPITFTPSTQRHSFSLVSQT